MIYRNRGIKPDSEPKSGNPVISDGMKTRTKRKTVIFTGAKTEIKQKYKVGQKSFTILKGRDACHGQKFCLRNQKFNISRY